VESVGRIGIVRKEREDGREKGKESVIRAALFPNFP
jgi:hypothetical protein